MFMLTFIIVQISLLIFLAFHDFVHIPPLTNIKDLKKLHSLKNRLFGAVFTSLFALIPLVLTLIFKPHLPLWCIAIMLISYGTLTFGTIQAWWIPYFFGSTEKHKAGFAEYKNTHHFLPKRGDNIIPNTFHVLLHLQVWFCFIFVTYLLIAL